ncbi:AAEL013532-PA [Aedes aegypti]|uniref:AAEL013532-PA n=1 Tax=Aedes aegypti TaxID=7159 RepID=Q16IV3_AEDAE|nr:AAEL013532-PA [Aedes aegypti]
MCKYYQISLFFIICVLCALSRSDVVQVQRPFEQKRSGVSYILAGNYTFQNKDNKGNDVARIFVPPPSFSGRRISPLPGSEGSSQLAPTNSIINYSHNKPWTPPISLEVQCSKYLDEIEKLKKTLQEQIESSKKVAHTTERPKKQSAKKVPAKASKKSTSAKSSQKDVYFNSRKTYDEMMKLFNKTTLAGVDPKIRANADYYLHHLKMNLLVLTSNIQDYSKIKTCFSNFLSRTQQLRDYMSYHYDSCKGHYEQTCNSNTLVSYQDGLNELEYMTAECIRQRIN